MTEQVQRFATGSRLLWPKGVNSWYIKSFTPVPSSELIHGLSNWVIFLLKFLNRWWWRRWWWWRRQIIQKRLKNDYTHKALYALLPFSGPQGKKTNKTHNQPTKTFKKNIKTRPFGLSNHRKINQHNFHRENFFLWQISGLGVVIPFGWALSAWQVFEVDQSLVGRIIGKKAPAARARGAFGERSNPCFFWVRVWLLLRMNDNNVVFLVCVRNLLYIHIHFINWFILISVWFFECHHYCQCCFYNFDIMLMSSPLRSSKINTKHTITLSSLGSNCLASSNARARTSRWSVRSTTCRFGSKIHETRAPIAGGNFVKMEEAFSPFESENHLGIMNQNLLAHIDGEGNHGELIIPSESCNNKRILPGWRCLDPPKKRWNRRGMNWNSSRLSSCN